MFGVFDQNEIEGIKKVMGEKVEGLEEDVCYQQDVSQVLQIENTRLLAEQNDAFEAAKYDDVHFLGCVGSTRWPIDEGSFIDFHLLSSRRSV